MIQREDFPDTTSYLQEVFRARRRRIRLIILLIVAAIAGCLLFFYEFYKVRNVIVSGNTRYTDEQIAGFVMTGPLGNNSIVLSLRYRNKDVPDVPFVERMDVSVVQHDTIRITVYEMALAGYVNYLGRYMYFSRDGTVVESSTVALEDVPEVVGLDFSHIALYQKLPVTDESVFRKILEISQVLKKYEVNASKIYFDSSGDISLYFDQVRADLGEGEYLDEKISNIAQILPKLKGRTGVLKMAQYEPGTRYITFVIRSGTVSAAEDTGDTEEDAAGAATEQLETGN